MTSPKKKFEIEAAVRQDLGKGASRRLRRDEKVPGVLYGGGKETVTLEFAHNKLAKALESEAFYSQILNLQTGSDKERVVLKDLQRHPYKPRILHVDFLRVRADEKLTMSVPLHFLNSEKAIGVKDSGGIISHIESDIEVICLPDNLPEFIEIDVANLQLNQTLHMSDLKLPQGVEITSLLQGNDRPIVSIHMPRVEEEPLATEAPQAADVPAIAQKSEEPKK